MENNKVKSKNKSKNKSVSKIINPKNKTCKQFCKNVFIPEMERVATVASNNFRNKYRYKPLKVLRKTNKPLAKMMQNMFLNDCNDIYCQKSCKNSKNKWLKSFTKKRKENLIQQGAISGCKDLIKKFPKHYQDI
jgi:hypothetical protein